jgi:hypothetical protein
MRLTGFWEATNYIRFEWIVGRDWAVCWLQRNVSEISYCPNCAKGKRVGARLATRGQWGNGCGRRREKGRRERRRRNGPRVMTHKGTLIPSNVAPCKNKKTQHMCTRLLSKLQIERIATSPLFPYHNLQLLCVL